MVQVFHCGRTRQETTYIASPTGQRNNELSMSICSSSPSASIHIAVLDISSVLFSKQKNTTLKPCITPVHSFETPIQQIIASSAINEADEPVHGVFIIVHIEVCLTYANGPMRRNRTWRQDLYLHQLSRGSTFASKTRFYGPSRHNPTVGMFSTLRCWRPPHRGHAPSSFWRANGYYCQRYRLCLCEQHLPRQQAPVRWNFMIA